MMVIDRRIPTSGKMAKPTPSYRNPTASSAAKVLVKREAIARKSIMTATMDCRIPTSPKMVKPSPSYQVSTASSTAKMKKPEVVVEKRMIATLHLPAVWGGKYSKSSHLMEKRKKTMLAITNIKSQTMSTPNSVNFNAISLEKKLLVASSTISCFKKNEKYFFEKKNLASTSNIDQQSRTSQGSLRNNFNGIKKNHVDALTGQPSKANLEKNPVRKLTPTAATSLSARVTPSPVTPLEHFEKREMMVEASNSIVKTTLFAQVTPSSVTPLEPFEKREMTAEASSSGVKTTLSAQVKPNPVTSLQPYEKKEMMAEASTTRVKTTLNLAQSGFYQVDVPREKNEKMVKTYTHHQMMLAPNSSRNCFFTGEKNKARVVTSIRSKIGMKKTPNAARVIARKKLVGKGALVPRRSKTRSLAQMSRSPPMDDHKKNPDPPDNDSDTQVALEKLHALLDSGAINHALSESMRKDQVIYELRTCAELEKEVASHRALNKIQQDKLHSQTQVELKKQALADEDFKKKDAEISELKKTCAQLLEELQNTRILLMEIFESRMIEARQSLSYEESKKKSVLWAATDTCTGPANETTYCANFGSLAF